MVVFDEFVAIRLETQAPAIAGGAPTFVPWELAPTTIAGGDITAVVAAYCSDTDMVVVPDELAKCAGGIFAMMEIRHMAAAEHVATSWVMPFPWLRTLLMRAGKVVGDRVRAVPIFAIKLTRHKLRAMWEALYTASGEQLLQQSDRRQLLQKVDDIVDTHAKDTVFDVSWHDDASQSGYELTNDVTKPPQGRLDAAGTGPPLREAWERAGVLEKILVSHVTPSDGRLRKVVDMLAYMGNTENPDVRISPQGAYNKVTGSIMQATQERLQGTRYGDMVLGEDALYAEEVAKTLLSCSHSWAHRELPLSKSHRILEALRMVDLAARSESTRASTFEDLLPVVMASREMTDLAWVVGSGGTPMELRTAMEPLVNEFMGGKVPHSAPALQELQRRVQGERQRYTGELAKLPRGVERAQKLVEKVSSISEQLQTLQKDSSHSGTSSSAVSTPKMTARELMEVKNFLPHKLHQRLELVVATLQQKGATASDYVGAVLRCGIPRARRYLLRLDEMPTGIAPYDVLKEYRVPAKGDYLPIRKYLGATAWQVLKELDELELPEGVTEVLLQETATSQLMTGQISKVVWEQVFADIRRQVGIPVSADTLQSFTWDTRFEHDAVREQVKAVALAVLVACGLESPNGGEGSFASMIEAKERTHRLTEDLRPVHKAESRHSKVHGSMTAFLQGFQDADANYARFMATPLSEFTVEGDNDKVTQALIPFVPTGSPYFTLLAASKIRNKYVLEQKVHRPHEWCGAEDLPGDTRVILGDTNTHPSYTG